MIVLKLIYKEFLLIEPVTLLVALQCAKTGLKGDLSAWNVLLAIKMSALVISSFSLEDHLDTSEHVHSS